MAAFGFLKISFGINEIAIDIRGQSDLTQSPFLF
jgi:hypothetical protein